MTCNHTSGHILWLIYREALASVFDSVYAVPASLLSRHGFQIHMLVFSAFGEWLRSGARSRWRHVRERLNNIFPGQISRIPVGPSRFSNLRLEKILFPIWYKMSRRARLIHCGGARITATAVRSRRTIGCVPVIYHCWGLDSDELLYEAKMSHGDMENPKVLKLANQLRFDQKEALEEAEITIVVSNAMRCHLMESFNVKSDRLVVVPCCVDTSGFKKCFVEREAVRNELGLRKKIVVAYNGSLFRWQLPERCIEIFLRIQKIYRNAHFLGITTQPSRMQSLLDQYHVDGQSRTVLSLCRHDVPRYLCGADIGLLIRENCLINRVASPVKYAEYLAAGVPVIMTDGVGDYSAFTEANNLGLVIPGGEDWSWKSTHELGEFVESCVSNRLDWQSRCQEFAEKHLDWSVHLPKIIGVYNALLQR